MKALPTGCRIELMTWLINSKSTYYERGSDSCRDHRDAFSIEKTRIAARIAGFFGGNCFRMADKLKNEPNGF